MTDINFLNCGVAATNELKIDLAVDSDRSNVKSHSGSTQLDVNLWYYVVYSFEMSQGKDTLVEVFLNNASDGSTTLTNVFLLDGSSYPGYIASKRTTGVSDFGDRWNGYIYEFVLYQSKHTISNTAHASTCITDCLTIDFDEFFDSSTQSCSGTNCTDRSCVKSGTCQLTSECKTSFDFCHLCLDRECVYCTDYTSCDASECLATGFASESAGVCSCNTGYGRGTTNDIC